MWSYEIFKEKEVMKIFKKKRFTNPHLVMGVIVRARCTWEEQKKFTFWRMMLSFWKKCLIVSVSSVPFAMLWTEADLSWYPPRDSWQTRTKTITLSLNASSVCLHLLLNAVMSIWPGFVQRKLVWQDCGDGTIVTSEASDFLAKLIWECWQALSCLMELRQPLLSLV